MLTVLYCSALHRLNPHRDGGVWVDQLGSGVCLLGYCKELNVHLFDVLATVSGEMDWMHCTNN